MTPYNDPDKFPLRNPFAPALISEARVPKSMPQVLGSWDMTVMFVASTYLVTSATRATAGGSAALVSILLAGLTFFLPCLIVTAQLGNMFPHEGAVYNWTQRAIGGYWSFFAGLCMWFPGIFVSGNVASLFIGCTQKLLHFSFTAPLQQGFAISAVLLVAGVISTKRLRNVQSLINILVILLLISTVVIGLITILWLVKGHHPATSFHDWSVWKLEPGNFSVFGGLVSAFMGADRPLILAGEIVGRRAIRRHLLWGGGLIFTLYLVSTSTVLIVQGPEGATDPLAMVASVTSVLGEPLSIVMTLCLMGSFFATLLVYNSIFARLLLVVAIDHRLPASIYTVNKRQVPVYAIFFQTLLTIIFTLLIFGIVPIITGGVPTEGASPASTVVFSVEVYSVIQATGSLIWMISTPLLFVDLVCCYLRDRFAFCLRCIFPIPLLLVCALLGTVSSIVTIITTLLFSWTPLIANAYWIYLIGSLTMTFLIIALFGSMIARSEAAWREIRNILLDTAKRRALPKKFGGFS